MHQGRILLAWVTISLVAVTLVACGSRSGLQSLTITPAEADAKNFPNGQVQFTAMGTFPGSSQAKEVNALWWTFRPWTPPPPAAATPTPPTMNISADGLATCLGTGMFTLWATAPVDQTQPLTQMTASTRQLSATAQLTCP